MNPRKIQETEELITQLCQRFTNIFEQIKEIKQSRVELEDENYNLQQMIQEETHKFEDASKAMEQATEQLQKQNEQLENGQAEQQQQNGLGSEKIQQIKTELDNKKTILEVAQVKLKEINAQLQQELSAKEGLDAQKYTVEDNLRNIQDKIQEHQDISVNVENNLDEINVKNEELAEKIKNLILTIESNEEQLRKSMEEKCSKEDEYKVNLQDYREVLNQTSTYQKQTKETEKLVGKLSDELRSKLKRLEVLLKNKIKLESKLGKHEGTRLTYDQITQENAQLEEENYKIRAKLELYVEPESNSNNYIDRSFSSIRKKAQQQQQNGQESQLYKDVKYNVLQSQYLESMMKDLQDKDNQIYKNKKRIQELNTEIEQAKVRLIEKRLDKDKLLGKLEIIKSSTQDLGNKYEQMCSEYGIEPYQNYNNNIDTNPSPFNSSQQQPQNQSTSKKLQFSQDNTPVKTYSALQTLK